MREKNIQKIEVHVAGICFRDDKVLIAKRSDQKKMYPSLWECGGGKIEFNETFEEALVREFLEEFGVKIDIMRSHGTYCIKTNSKKILGVKFICKYESGEVCLSEEHTEFVWVTVDDLDNYEFIPGVAEELKKAFELV